MNPLSHDSSVLKMKADIPSKLQYPLPSGHGHIAQGHSGYLNSKYTLPMERIAASQSMAASERSQRPPCRLAEPKLSSLSAVIKSTINIASKTGSPGKVGSPAHKPCMKATSVFAPLATHGAAVDMARLYRNDVTETRAPPGANSVSYPH